MQPSSSRCFAPLTFIRSSCPTQWYHRRLYLSTQEYNISYPVGNVCPDIALWTTTALFGVCRHDVVLLQHQECPPLLPLSLFPAVLVFGMDRIGQEKDFPEGEGCGKRRAHHVERVQPRDIGGDTDVIIFGGFSPIAG